MLSWKRAKVDRALKQLLPLFLLSLLILGLFWTIQTGNSLLGPVGMFLGAWILSGALLDLINRTGQSRDLSRLFRLPRADWGKATAHGGLGVTFIGIALLTAWQVEDIRVAREGETFRVGAYDITLIDVREADEYAAGHIPGARFLDLASLKGPGSSVPNALPTGAQIAERLVVSDGAVAKHVANIFRGLDLQPGEENRRVRAVLAWLHARA